MSRRPIPSGASAFLAPPMGICLWVLAIWSIAKLIEMAL